MTGRPVKIVPALLLAVVLAWTVLADTGAALDFFRAGSYGEARSALDAAASPNADGTDLLLRALLERRPDEALALLDGAAAGLPAADPLRLSALVDAAALRAARGEHAAVVAGLRPLLDADPQTIPGRALLLAGQSLRMLGDKEQAAQMLATVRPEDPAFAAARTALGDLALDDGDAPLALRYYESADQDERTGSGRWQALRLAERDGDAERVLRGLRTSAPGCLALLDINRRLSVEADEEAARLVPDSQESVATRPQAEAGRYTLQFGAFSDRGLALDLQRRYRDLVPDLRIDEVRDARGQYLYKVRTGSFVNPALARNEASRLQRTLGVDVFVADLVD